MGYMEKFIETLTKTNQITSWSRALLEKLAVVWLFKNFQEFYEPKGSLPRSKEPSTGPYPEPDQSSPHHPILSL
jgi:hypothetical protein